MRIKQIVALVFTLALAMTIAHRTASVVKASVSNPAPSVTAVFDDEFEVVEEGDSEAAACPASHCDGRDYCHFIEKIGNSCFYFCHRCPNHPC